MNTMLDRLNQKAAMEGLPLNGTLELTPRCNLHCKMCYIHRPECLPEKLGLKPLSFWLDMARQAKAMGTLVLVITGGEPFLYPEAETLLEKLMEMGFVISLNTNGTLLDDRRIAWLNAHRPAKINISLYGASDATYSKLCGINDGFFSVSSSIDNLLKNGHNVYLNGTLTPENVGDLPAMVEFAGKRKLALHNTSYLFPPGRYGIHSVSSRLTPIEAAQADLLLEKLQLGQEALLEKSRQQIRLVTATINGTLAPYGGFHSGDGCCRSNCGGGRNAFAISWDGKLMPCVTNAGIAIPLDEQPLAQAWQTLRRRVAELTLPKECVRCPYQMICNACPATIYNETGRYDRLSSYTCDVIRAHYAARLALVRQHEEAKQ